MRRIALSLALLAAAAAYAPVAAPPSSASAGTLAARIETAIRRKSHKDVQFSLGVWDARTGRRIAATAADTPRRTASVTKLVTTGGALLLLGADHELTTEARATAAPVAGVVRGDLVIEGTGDPGFSTHLVPDGVEAEMRRFARQVREAGVTRVTGDLVIDTSAFPGPGRHPGWGWREGTYDWYMAPVTAVTLGDGCVDVTALPGAAPGAPARLEMTPPNAVVQLLNRLTTTSDRKSHVVAFGPDEGDTGAAGPRRIAAKGSVWTRSTGFTASLACVDPPELFGDVLGRALAAEGVAVGGGVRVLRGPPAAPWPRSATRPGVVVARHATRLADAVGVTNRKSQNLWAELVLRHAGLATAGDGSTAGGVRAVGRALGADATGITQADGSGLARENVATVGGIGRVLMRLFDSPHRLEFMGSLARGGEDDGTLRKRFRGERFEGRVLGKTGTLRDTSALAGYVLAGEESVLAFVILCEGAVWRARDLQDAVVTALVDG